jgi:hypothetical protein
MKKLLILSLFFLVGAIGFSQHNDTLYYKSGKVKAVTIRQHDEKFVTYEYRTSKGKLGSNRIAKKALKSFVIYNEHGELVYDSLKPKKKED